MTDFDTSRTVAQNQMLVPPEADCETHGVTATTDLDQFNTNITVEASRKFDKSAMRELAAIAFIGMALGIIVRIWSSHRG